MALIDRNTDAPGKSAPQEDQGQAIVKKLGMAAMKLIFSQPVSNDIIARLEAGKEDPAKAVGSAALVILNKLAHDVQGINPELVFSVSLSVVVWIMELGQAAGVLQPDMAMLKAAMAALTAEKQGAGVPQGAAPQEPAPQAVQVQEPNMMGA